MHRRKLPGERQTGLLEASNVCSISNVDLWVFLGVDYDNASDCPHVTAAKSSPMAVAGRRRDYFLAQTTLAKGRRLRQK